MNFNIIEHRNTVLKHKPYRNVHKDVLLRREQNGMQRETRSHTAARRQRQEFLSLEVGHDCSVFHGSVNCTDQQCGLKPFPVASTTHISVCVVISLKFTSFIVTDTEDFCFSRQVCCLFNNKLFNKCLFDKLQNLLKLTIRRNKYLLHKDY